MRERERENAERAARGGALLPMPREWVDRPLLHPHEEWLFNEFLMFAQFCGGDPRPTDALAWFEMRGVASEEREWMSWLFSCMSGALRVRREASDD